MIAQVAPVGCPDLLVGTDTADDAGRLLIRIAPVTGDITDLEYQHTWSGWLDGELLGKGYCIWPEQTRERAIDLVTSEQVTSMVSVEPEPRLF